MRALYGTIFRWEGPTTLTSSGGVLGRLSRHPQAACSVLKERSVAVEVLHGNCTV